MAAKATVQKPARWLAELHGSKCPNFHQQETFLKLLHTEQKRLERSNRRFVLMLAEPLHKITSEVRTEYFKKLLSVIPGQIRETDLAGWYEDGRVIGVILTEIETTELPSLVEALRTRFTAHLGTVDSHTPSKLQFHVCPDDWTDTETGHPLPPPPSSRLLSANEDSAFDARIKRLLDITGSALALTLGAPLFGAIAIAIKISSPGPLLFKQQRVGKNGMEFTFLKFRSMQPASDTSIHEAYVKAFIAGEGAPANPAEGTPNLYKLTSDPRVTSIGRFLRRTSLDELPQFYNVLKGDMSLVGPRPPIPYEVSRYKLWHKRRFLTVKPGLTGLWQVTGRSQTTFDEMVRLDLRYARCWSIWIDLKILLQTPITMIKGEGAC